MICWTLDRPEYVLMLMTFIHLPFQYDYTLFGMLIAFTFNLANYIFIALVSADKTRYKEIIGFILLFLFLTYYLRSKTLLQRRDFLKNNQMNKMISYFDDLIDNMNGMLFSIKNDEVCVYNKSFLAFVKEEDCISFKDKESVMVVNKMNKDFVKNFDLENENNYLINNFNFENKLIKGNNNFELQNKINNDRVNLHKDIIITE